MAFHHGITLREKIASTLTVNQSIRIAAQIAAGLANAHKHGIFHRDIKPGNVLIAPDGIARIIDFGLATSNNPDPSRPGIEGATPLYMSPEQASGYPLDYRTDLWSLGAVLHEMLTGTPPFSGTGPWQLRHLILDTEPPKLRYLRPHLPPSLEAIVDRALQKDPKARYQSAANIAKDLSDALVVLQTPTTRVGLRAVYAIPLVLSLIAVFAISGWYFHHSRKRQWALEQALR